MNWIIKSLPMKYRVWPMQKNKWEKENTKIRNPTQVSFVDDLCACITLYARISMFMCGCDKLCQRGIRNKCEERNFFIGQTGWWAHYRIPHMYCTVRSHECLPIHMPGDVIDFRSTEYSVSALPSSYYIYRLKIVLHTYNEKNKTQSEKETYAKMAKSRTKKQRQKYSRIQTHNCTNNNK